MPSWPWIRRSLRGLLSHSGTGRDRRPPRCRRIVVESLEERQLLAVFSVSSFLDTVDANVGDGVAQDAAGNTTLRAAIMEANAASGVDTINLPAGTYTLTRAGSLEDAAASGDLDISEDVNLIGAGSATTVIDASFVQDRILDLAGSATVDIRNLTFTGGQADNNGVSDGKEDGGGAIAIGAFNNVTISDCEFDGNSAPEIVHGLGGAIYSAARSLAIDACRFNGNSTGGYGGAVYSGGMVNEESGTLTVTESTFVVNSAAGGGGAIANQSDTTIEASTFAQNTADFQGGAIDNNNYGDLTLINSTLSGNQALGGGAIITFDSLQTTNSTFTGNIGTQRGGGVFVNEGTATMENTLLAGNSTDVAGPDVFGAVNSLGHNLIGDTTDSSGFGAAGDLLGVAPKLGPLADNGGPTLTHALLSGSPAIDAGDTASAPATDQRGIARPVGANADIGAFEVSVQDNLSLTLDIDVNSISESAGSGAATGTVTRSTGTSGNLTLSLTSSDVSEATVPATVTIPDGAESATFGIDAVNDSSVDGSQSVTIAVATQSQLAVGLDGTFGTAGLVSLPSTTGLYPWRAAMAQQPDGKIIAAVSEGMSLDDRTWQITRLNEDGTIDTSFGTNGIVDTTLPAGSLAIVEKVLVQPDGKILVGGDNGLGTSGAGALVRYHADGTIDTSFGVDGFADTASINGWIEDMVLRPDGKIVLGIAFNGTVYLRVAQLNADGTMDTSFGTNGVTTLVDANDSTAGIDRMDDGRIVVAGGSFRNVARLQADGSLDATFGTDGVATINTGLTTADRCNDVVIDDQGRIVLAGYGGDGTNPYDMVAVRLNVDGSMDSSFGSGGTVAADIAGEDDVAFRVAIQDDAKILLAGAAESPDDVAFVRLHPNGTLDASFDNDGRFRHSAVSSSGERTYDVALRDDGTLLAMVGVGTDLRIGRYNLGGPLAQASDTLLVTDDDGAGDILGKVFHDLDGDGVLDAGEQGLAGWTVYADENGNGQYDEEGGGEFAAWAVPVAIDGSTVHTSTLTIPAGVGSITDLNVTLDISHTYDSDLDVYLIGPDGTRVELFTDVGSSDNDFAGTTLDDDATTAIGAGTAPFSGTYRPEGSLSDFDGKTATGQWTLEITDDFPTSEFGTLNSWALEVSTSGGETSALTNADGSYVLSGLAAGAHKIGQVPVAGWNQTVPAGGFHTVSLVAGGDDVADVDFGNEELPKTTTEIIAAVDGEAADETPFDGVFEGLDTTYFGMTVDNDSTNESRAIMEFDLSSIPTNETITSATLTLNTWLLNTNDQEHPTLRFYGYTGDGQISLADATVAGVLLGEEDVASVSPVSVSISPDFIQSLLDSGQYAGIRVQQVPANSTLVSFVTSEGARETSRPRLTIETVQVPEALGSVSGVKWEDANGNGVRDAGEPGLAGVTIYVDANQNGRLDPDELSTVTRQDDPGTTGVDETGMYELLDVPPGMQTVAEVVPQGFEQTFPTTASAPTGELFFPQTYEDGVDGIDGLAGARGMAVSPDGRHLYVVGFDDDSVAVFERDESGEQLTYVGHVRNNQGGVEGLRGATAIAVSPDGKHVYVASSIDDAVAVLSRNATTGELTFVEAIENGESGVEGLLFANSIAISPDGAHVYATGEFDDALVIFSRNATTGRLTFVETHTDGVGDVTGLISARSVIVSPDGKHVYACSEPDGAIALFQRNLVTGRLTFVQAYVDGANGLDGLGGVTSIAVASDGSHLFAFAPDDTMVSMFARNSVTGQLSMVGSVENAFFGIGTHLVVSPDNANIYVSSKLNFGSTPDIFIIRRDLETGQLTLVNSIGDMGGDFLLVSPDGNNVYVTADDRLTSLRRDGAAERPSGHVVDVPAGGSIGDLDFGNRSVYGEIRGTTWEDLNSDGDRDAGEPAIGGVTVYLDLNRNGQLDAGEPQAVSNGSGEYLFTDVAPGHHVVGQIATDTLEQTTPGLQDLGLTLASLGSTGEQAHFASGLPSLSADGRYVAFVSSASNLVPGDTNMAADIFVRDQVTGAVERVSISSDGAEADGGSSHPVISDDGRYIVFASRATNLVAGDANGASDIFVFDRSTKMTTRVSVASDGTGANDDSGTFIGATLSADGRYVVFDSYASNLVVGDTNGTYDVFLHDLQNGTTERLSEAADGSQGVGMSYWPTISPDGRYVAFYTRATNLLPDAIQPGGSVIVLDRQDGSRERVDLAHDGGFPDRAMTIPPQFSADGRYAVFGSSASNLITGDTNGHGDIFVRDLQTGAIERISIADDGTEGNGVSTNPDISPDGRYVTFRSNASNLVSGDTNESDDVFLYDRLTDTMQRINTGADGTQAEASSLGFISTSPTFSGDGSVIAFASAAGNLVPGDRNGTADVFLYYPDAADARSHVVFVGAGETLTGVDFGNQDVGYDYGDAPLPYATTLAANGARHLAMGPFLGATRDEDADGSPSASADGDDLAGSGDDEDGVVFSALRPGRLESISVEVGESGGYVDAWIDFDGSGTWEGWEQIHADFLPAGTHAVSVIVPLDAAVGQTYARFRISSTGGLAPSGAAADGEVEDYAVTIENEIHLLGTGGDDTITIRAGAAGSSLHQVTINGVLATFDPAVYDAIYVDGMGGNDRADLYGLDDSNDTFYGLAGGSRMEVGGTFVAWADNCETVYGHAGTAAAAGLDKAYLGGTADDDTFVGSDGSSYVTGGGYLFATRQFDWVEADVTGSGGTDKAFFNDTVGDDDYYGQPTQAWIELDSGVVNRAVGFVRTRATSSGSGSVGDRAFLTGADGQDKFIARFDIGYMFGADYLNSSAGFDYVEADVSGTTGDDWAYFSGTGGDDVYFGSVTEGRMELSNGVTTRGIGFPNQYALAEGHANGDVAYLSGTPSDDTFVAGDGYAYTYGSNILHSTRQFETVEADMSSDGYDRAALSDTSGVDKFYGGLDESRFELSSGVVNTAKGAFDIVYAYGTPATADEAYLLGTAGDDRFVAGDGYAYLAATGKTNAIRRFDYVEADVAGTGGTDTAQFEDTAGDDTYYGQATRAWIELSSGITNKAVGFASTQANATAGSGDWAYLYGTAGDDTYHGNVFEGRMELSNGVTNRAVGFPSYRAFAAGHAAGDSAYLTGSADDDTFVAGEGYAYVAADVRVNSIREFEYVEADVSGSGGSDTATLRDSSLVDLFTADGDEASFDYGNDGDLEALARGFARVNADSTEGGPDKRDDDQAHSFLLTYYGSEWE